MSGSSLVAEGSTMGGHLSVSMSNLRNTTSKEFANMIRRITQSAAFDLHSVQLSERVTQTCPYRNGPVADIIRNRLFRLSSPCSIQGPYTVY